MTQIVQNGLKILRTAVNEESSSRILLIPPSICFHNIYIYKITFDVVIEEHLLQFSEFFFHYQRGLEEQTFHFGERRKEKRSGGKISAQNEFVPALNN